MSFRIGLVGLCTSHPESWVPIIREYVGQGLFDAEITAAWDSGETRPEGFAKDFCKQFDIPNAVENLEDMLPLVECVEIMAGPGKLNAVRCGGCGFNDKFIIDFSNIFEESDIEKRFFTALVKMGAHVKIESNRR